MKGKKKLIIIGIVFLLILLIPFFITMFIYEQNFDIRFITNEYLKYDLSDFEGLERTSYKFKSNNGQILAGYKYYKDEIANPAGVIIISHGLGGGGHNSYMNYANFFTSNNYFVFAYDGTGNDESEGKSIHGLSQAVIDLDHAIRFIEGNDGFKGLPIILMGHSWGAYAAGVVLNIHPGVKAVLSLSGFNKPIDIMVEQGKNMMGGLIYSLKPYLSLYEYMKFGKYSKYNCLDGYDNTAAHIIIVHSEDDQMISFNSSYSIYYNKYKDNPRFTFISFTDHGHNYPLLSQQALEYIDEFNKSFKDIYDKYDGDIPEDVLSETYAQLDKTLAFEFDLETMGLILDIFNSD